MLGKPQKEHKWLERLVGNWTYESEMACEPGKPPVKVTGTESIRSIGGMWIVCEGACEMPGVGAGTMIMTLGYDAGKKRYVGSWIGSMMGNMWTYVGKINAAGNVLTLDTEGPDCTSKSKKLVAYRDAIEVKNKNHKVLRSSMRGKDGKWMTLMTANYRRVK